MHLKLAKVSLLLIESAEDVKDKDSGFLFEAAGKGPPFYVPVETACVSNALILYGSFIDQIFAIQPTLSSLVDENDRRSLPV